MFCVSVCVYVCVCACLCLWMFGSSGSISLWQTSSLSSVRLVLPEASFRLVIHGVPYFFSPNLIYKSYKCRSREDFGKNPGLTSCCFSEYPLWEESARQEVTGSAVGHPEGSSDFSQRGWPHQESLLLGGVWRAGGGLQGARCWA